MMSVTIISGLAFLAILFILHFIKPEFDPSWRMISEYEIGKNGWMMRVAFFIWAICIGSFVFNLLEVSGTIHYVIYIWYSVIAIALIGAGTFKTDPITNSTNSFTNVMHKVCGSIMILTFPIIGTVFTVTYIKSEEISMKWLLIIMTALLWMGQIWFFMATASAQKKNPNVKQGSPEIKLGWPNRIMVIIYVIWLIFASISINQ